MVILDFEILNPIWVEVADDPHSTKISLKQYSDPVLFPSDTQHEKYDYWKVPGKATISLLVHRPERGQKR